ncbi:MAG: hypothetical protein WC551_09490 [Patescibacteria group bacterium]
MISGRWEADDYVDAEIIPADGYRDILTIQLHSAKGCVYLGFGAAAVVDESLLVVEPGDSVTIRGHLARQSVHALGSLSYGAYQEGDLSLNIQDGGP